LSFLTCCGNLDLVSSRRRYDFGMVNVRGSVLMARLRWLVEKHGEKAYDETLADLAPAHAEAIRMALPTTWVPFDAYIAICVAMDKRYGKGDLALCRELGRYSASANLPTLYRVFYKLGTVPYIMSKSAAVWSEHYDSGSARFVEHAKGDLSIIVENFETPHKAHCLAVLGWIEESVRISGAQMLTAAEIRCRTNGDAYCEFRGRYE
jgi:hypothetical protein